MTTLLYNSFKKDIMNGSIDLDTDTIKVMLVTSDYTPDMDLHTRRSNVTNEVTGTGYTAGGMTLTSPTVTQNNTLDQGVFDANDVTWTGATITARGAVLYKSRGGLASADELIGYVDFGSNVVSSGENFVITWSSNGILAFATTITGNVTASWVLTDYYAFAPGHPEQAISLSLTTPITDFTNQKLGILVPETGVFTEIPYQPISTTRLAIRADLPTGVTRHYQLRNTGPRITGTAPTNPLVFSENATYYEITNGLTGVRVWKQDQGNDKPPIYGLRLRGGTWKDSPAEVMTVPFNRTTPLTISSKTVTVGSWNQLDFTFTATSPPFQTRGSFTTAFKVDYTFTNGGSYSVVIWMYANDPIIMLDETATNCYFQWSADFTPANFPVQLRWQGNFANTLDAGSQFAEVVDWPNNPVLAYSSIFPGDFREAMQIIRPTTNYRLSNDHLQDTGTGGRRRGMYGYGAYGVDAGFYQLVVDPTLPTTSTADVWGLFSARTSRIIKDDLLLPGVYNTSAPSIGVQSISYSDFVPTTARKQWGIWVGLRNQVQGGVNGEDTAPVLLDYARRYGQYGLDKLYRFPGTFDPLPAGSDLYMPTAAVNANINLIQGTTITDTGYRDYLLSWLPFNPQINYYWGLDWDLALANSQLAAMKSALTEDRNTTLTKILSEESRGVQKPQPGQETARLWSENVLNAHVILTSIASNPDKAFVRAAMELFTQMAHDNDFFPIQNSFAEASLGNGNQIAEFVGVKESLAYFLGNDPDWVDEKNEALAAVVAAVRDTESIIANDGSVQGSLGNYWGSILTGPLTSLIQGHQLTGTVITGATQDSPTTIRGKLDLATLWGIHMQTPQEPRFGRNVGGNILVNGRKSVAAGNGDTSTDTSFFTGIMGTALAYAQTPSLTRSKQGMAAWRAASPHDPGGPHFDPFHQTLLKIDNTLVGTVDDLRGALVSTQFVNSYTKLVTSPESNLENNIWFSSGNKHGDHHHNDEGMVIAYLLSCPLMYDWSGPNGVGATDFHHSCVLVEDGSGNLGGHPRPWTANNWPNNSLDETNFLSEAATTTAEAFNDKDHATRPHYGKARIEVSGSLWRREVQLFPSLPNPHNGLYPTLAIQDTIRNSADTADVTTPRVATFLQMATGAVTIPVSPGSYTPTTAFWDAGGTQESMSTGTVFNLSSGAVAGQNNFRFIGQTWLRHWAQGIDWDVWFYTPSGSPQFLIGNWGTTGRIAHPDFLVANPSFSRFEERQHLLRFRSTAKTTVAITAYPKGQRPPGLQAQVIGSNLVVSWTAGTLATIPL